MGYLVVAAITAICIMSFGIVQLRKEHKNPNATHRDFDRFMNDAGLYFFVALFGGFFWPMVGGIGGFVIISYGIARLYEVITKEKVQE